MPRRARAMPPPPTIGEHHLRPHGVWQQPQRQPAAPGPETPAGTAPPRSPGPAPRAGAPLPALQLRPTYPRLNTGRPPRPAPMCAPARARARVPGNPRPSLPSTTSYACRSTMAVTLTAACASRSRSACIPPQPRPQRAPHPPAPPREDEGAESQARFSAETQVRRTRVGRCLPKSRIVLLKSARSSLHQLSRLSK